MKELGKMFSATKKNNSEHTGNSVHTVEPLGLGKALNIYINYVFNVLPMQTTCEMKALQIRKFTFNNDFMMNRGLNFRMSRNDFGYVVICWWMTLFLKVSY